MFKLTAVAMMPDHETVEWDKPWFVDVFVKFEDQQEFEEIASKLPKYVNFHKNGWNSRVYLAENGANRGRNENGIKRIKKLIEVVGPDKIEIWQLRAARNTYKTLEAFTKALNG